ncbi:MAG: aspartate-semialdehyde dehydrogenase [Gammaproteobacteria bacterium]
MSVNKLNKKPNKKLDKKLNIAVLGATGMIGEIMLEVLAQRDFPVAKLWPLASKRSAGESVAFKNRLHQVQDVAEFDFSQVDLAFFSAGSEASKIYAPIAAEAGCIVIDKSAYFRQDPEVPLIVPEVNPGDIQYFRNKNIIANPNCSTIPMLVALKPIYDAVGIERINVATYQSVSGTGKKAVDELVTQVGDLLNGRPVQKNVYPEQIAFNVLPQIDVFQDNDYTKEEMKMHWETQKILGDGDILVNATAVRVPVFYGHSLAVHLETREKISIEAVQALLREAPGVILKAEPENYPSPITQMAEDNKTDAVYVGRLREDFTHPRGINLWIVADNTRKGAAVNGIQIAELLLEYL